MAMGARGFPGLAHQGNDLPPFHFVAGSNKELAVVPVARRIAEPVVNHDHVAVASGPPGEFYHAIRRGSDGRSSGAGDIHPLVGLPETVNRGEAEPKMGGEVS